MVKKQSNMEAADDPWEDNEYAAETHNHHRRYDPEEATEGTCTLPSMTTGTGCTMMATHQPMAGTTQ